PPAAHRGEPAQGQTVAPQGKAILRQKEGIAAQPLCALYGLSPPFVVGWEKREKERSYGDSSRHRPGAEGRLRSARLFSGLGRGEAGGLSQPLCPSGPYSGGECLRSTGVPEERGLFRPPPVGGGGLPGAGDGVGPLLLRRKQCGSSGGGGALGIGAGPQRICAAATGTSPRAAGRPGFKTDGAAGCAGGG